jgi:hypothetical protein
MTGTSISTKELRMSSTTERGQKLGRKDREEEGEEEAESPRTAEKEEEEGDKAKQSRSIAQFVALRQGPSTVVRTVQRYSVADGRVGGLAEEGKGAEDEGGHGARRKWVE